MSQPRLETLEPRVLLSDTPLPSLSDLESPGNTVVRFETTYGDIDIELFNSAAPVTVANFLNYVTSGRLDSTFFHRSDTDFVLQGGGFSYTDASGLTAVQTDAPIARESTGRSNLARTVAMARSTIDSATSQFFINYVDNVGLDPTAPDNGFAVFGRVIQGWSVVQAIQARPSLNLTSDPAFMGTLAGNFGEVPVTTAYSPAEGVREAALVTLINAEVIKPQGSFTFYEDRLVMPEGFRSDTTTETLKLTNPNDAPVFYQVIARYETGVRDTVIASGTIDARATISVVLSRAGSFPVNLVRPGVPYALVVEFAAASSLSDPLPGAAALDRADFGGTTSESFFNPALWEVDDLLTWDVARIERNSLSREFLVWQNLTDEEVTVRTRFITPAGTVEVVRTLGPYRRGGLEVHSLGLPEGTLAARVTADHPIAVALSDFDIPAEGVPSLEAYIPAFGVFAQPGGGAAVGMIGGVLLNPGRASNVLSISNPGASAATVTIRLTRSDLPSGATADPVIFTQEVEAGARVDVALDSAPAGPGGNTYAIRYSTDGPAVAAQFTRTVVQPRGQVQSFFSFEGESTMLLSRLPERAVFANGYFNPRAGATWISITNPFSSPTAVLEYTIRFSFGSGDGSTEEMRGTLAGDQSTAVLPVGSAFVYGGRTNGITLPVFGIMITGTVTDPANSLSLSTPGIVSLLVLGGMYSADFSTGPSVNMYIASLDDPLFR